MLAELVLASALAAGIALPHALPLERVAPLLAAGVWLLALTLRALVAIGGALFMFLYLPQTRLFEAIGHWCLHEVIPLVAAHLGLSGDPLAHAAVVLPALTLAASLLWVAVACGRSWLALRRLLQRSPGSGPWGTTLVADDRILLAATALGRARVVVSPAALRAMDLEELRAGMAHEIGHLGRRHRPLSLIGMAAAAIARPLPGTRRAQRELGFHLERDADEHAVRETRDPLALASAICKTAESHLPAALTPLGGRGGVGRRLDILLDGAGQRSRFAGRAASLAAVLLASMLLALAVGLPAWALTSPGDPHANLVGLEDCPD